MKRNFLVARACSIAALSVGLTFASAFADTGLIDAVRNGDRDSAIALLKKADDINATQADGTTALLWAAHAGDTDLVKRLIKKGADVTLENDYGASALSEAAVLGKTDMIKVLLKAGADPNWENPEGQTALMIVARTGNIDAAKALIKAGSQVNTKEDWGGQSALMWAAAQQHPAMVKLLIDKGADVNARGAVRNWQRKVTTEPRPKDMNKGGFTALLYAARDGCIECARHLVEAGADINLADPDRVTPLSLAILNFEFDTAAYLISAGANVDKWDLFGRTPLFHAVDMNIVPAGARPDIPSTDDFTGYDISKLLLERGANPDIQLKLRPPYRNVPFDRGGDDILSTGATALMRAAKASDNPLVELLLQHGATVDLINAEGVTPFMAAAGLGHGNNPTRGRFKTEAEGLETLKLLLAAGADINAHTPDIEGIQDGLQTAGGGGGFGGSPYAGQNAMHGAAKKGWTEVVRYLADHNSELQRVDSRGKTPLDLATGNYPAGFLQSPPEPFPETMSLLESYIAASGDGDVGL